MSTRFVTVKKFAEMSGYTPSAIYQKMNNGVWTEGRQFRKAPDGRVMINVEGVERWVEGQREPSKPAKAA